MAENEYSKVFVGADSWNDYWNTTNIVTNNIYYDFHLNILPKENDPREDIEDVVD
jgi:hypothetical protein